MSIGLKYKREKPIPREKVEKVKRLMRLFESYKNFLLIDIKDIPANMMKDIRRRFWGRGEFVVIKNTLARIAIDNLKDKKKNLSEIKKYLTGMRGIYFTNEDIFEVAREMASIRMKLPPKPGKICPVDIIIPKGSTGYKVGPVQTDFRLAGLPIRMIDGEIWIWEDTLFVRKGQRLTAQAAKILNLLDISPFEVGPEIVVGFYDGKIVSRDILLKPIEEYESMVKDAYRYVLNIAMNLFIPIEELLPMQLTIAIQQARSVAVWSGIVTDETAEAIISNAYIVAVNIAREIAKIDKKALPEKLLKIIEQKEETREEEKKEVKAKEEVKKEEKEEAEEGISGLASLFG